MSKSGGGTSTNTVQKADPWSAAQPYLKEIMAASKNLYDTQGAIQPYSGPELALLPDWLSGNILSGIGSTAEQAPWIQNQMFQSLAGALNPSATNWLGVNDAQIEGSGINANPAINYALYGNGMSPYLDTMAGDLVNKTQQAWGDTSRSMWEDLQQNTLPQIEGQFNQAGGLGSSRQALFEGQAIGRTNDALAREYGDLSTNLMGQLGNLYGGVYENAQNRSATLASQLAGLGSSERLAQAGMDLQAQLANQSTGLEAQNLDLKKILTQMQAGGMLPEIGQYPLGINEAMLMAYAPLLGQEQSLYDIYQNKYYEAAMAPYEAILRYAGIAQPSAGLGGTTSSSSSTDTSSSAASSIGSMLTLASLAKMLFSASDRRVKQDIKRVGTTDGGLPVYTFRYVWGGPVQMGVMADEVEKVKPEAIGEFAPGIKGVNYSMID